MLIGLSSVTYLRSAKADFEAKLKKGQDVTTEAGKIDQKGAALTMSVKEAKEAPAGAETVAAKQDVKDAVQKTGNDAVLLTQKISGVASSAPDSAKTGEQAVSKIVDKLSDAASVAPLQAANEVNKIAEAAQQANLPAVAQKARDTLKVLQQNPKYLEEDARAKVAKLKNVSDAERNALIGAVAELNQPAVKPLLDAVRSVQDSDTADAALLRASVAAALARMKKSVILDDKDAATVVSLLESPDRQTRVDASEVLMDLSDSASIRGAYSAMEPALKQPGEPVGTNGSKIYCAALVVATWARVLNSEIKAPGPDGQADPNKSMKVFALEKAQELLTRLNADGKGWRDTIELLKELIPKAGGKAPVIESAAAKPTPKPARRK
jgi:hypothetical protein